MIGIQRFFWLLVLTALVMICFPDFGMSGWTFSGTFILIWTGIILIMSIIGSLFGLYRFSGINRFLTWIFLLAVLGSMLWYFPQEDKVSPINKIKYGQFPTGSDIKRGLDKFTFNFAFAHRNARSDKNFINQQDPNQRAQQEAQKAKEDAKRQAAKKALEKLEIILEED